MIDTVRAAPLSRPRWLLVLMALLAVPNLIAGGWAIVSPRSWFDNFPGWAPQVVAAHPPYNDHLSFDAGAGLFASGVVMALAMFWPKREVAVTAAIAYASFALPHALWHLANPAAALSTADNANTAISLLLAVVGAAVVLYWHTSSRGNAQ